jgi:RND family efflux transporter MFP subunit
MTVELASPQRADVAQQLMVVGNLVGEQTVAVVPKTAGRLEEIFVKLGDPVARGQRIARIEDREIREQVKQAEAAFEVARATIRQREADLKFAETNLNRSRELFGRQLLPKQTLDDADARYQAAVAQLELSRAQLTQSQARLEELRINLANTVIVSPVTGFVARRNADPGAYASQNAPVMDLVDISLVRLVANIVEKDMRRVSTGDSANVEVDAFPGETFAGRIARVAPVLDPATRTAQIEIEIPNPSKRLKPGMYARVNLTVEQRANALVVPANAVVDREGQRGVFLASNNTAAFRRVEVGIEDSARIEILSGVTEKDQVITTGAAALQDGDRILLAGQGDGPSAPRGPGAGRGGARPGQGMRGQNNQRPGGGQGR